MPWTSWWWQPTSMQNRSINIEANEDMMLKIWKGQQECWFQREQTSSTTLITPKKRQKCKGCVTGMQGKAHQACKGTICQSLHWLHRGRSCRPCQQWIGSPVDRRRHPAELLQPIAGQHSLQTRQTLYKLQFVHLDLFYQIARFTNLSWPLELTCGLYSDYCLTSNGIALAQKQAQKQHLSIGSMHFYYMHMTTKPRQGIPAMI